MRQRGGARTILESNADMLGLMEERFRPGLGRLNDYQKEKLEDAYDKSMCGSNEQQQCRKHASLRRLQPDHRHHHPHPERAASIGWTSYSHTGVPVPVFAQGREAELFAGFYDNTDIAKKLAKAMDLPALPVEK
jgi:alkaline phosphatase